MLVALAVNSMTFKTVNQYTLIVLFRYILTTNFHIGELLKVPFQFNMFNIPATANKMDVNTLNTIAR